MTRYKVEFSGKDYPDYRPVSMRFFAPSYERAEEWAKMQLKAWGLLDKRVKFAIEEAPAVQEEDQEE